MKKLILIILLLPSLSYASPASKMFHELIGVVNSLKARSSVNRIPGYPLAESPGYYHFKYEEIGESKEALQKLLRAGHRYKDKYNRRYNAIPGYPRSEMARVQMTVSDLLGDIYYTDEQLAKVAKSLGYKGKLFDADDMITNDAYYYIEEHVLNVRSFRKVVQALEPEVNLDIFK